MSICGSASARAEQSTTTCRGVRSPCSAQAAAKATLSLRALIAWALGKGTTYSGSSSARWAMRNWAVASRLPMTTALRGDRPATSSRRRATMAGSSRESWRTTSM